MDKVDVIMLCGGRGSRLKELTGGKVPKSLVKIGDRELLSHSIKDLDLKYVNKIIFAINHYSEEIKQWVTDMDLSCDYVFSEQEVDGILPAINSAIEKVAMPRFVVCNTDEIREGFAFDDLIEFHLKHSRLATVVAAYSDNLVRHRVLSLNDNGQVIATKLKHRPYEDKPDESDLVNTGFWMLEKPAAEYFKVGGSLDWSEVIDPLVEAGQVYAFVMPQVTYFNVGTKEEYIEAATHADTNIVV